MKSESNGHAHFRVVLVATVKTELRQIHKDMMAQAKGSEFLAAVKQIVARLQKDPQDFGEAQYRLPALKLMIYQGVLLPIAVT